MTLSNYNVYLHIQMKLNAFHCERYMLVEAREGRGFEMLAYLLNDPSEAAICASKLSHLWFAPFRQKSIIWTLAGLLLIRSL